MSRRGFTLIELMIVVTIIATVAALAIPSLLRSKILAGESSIVATLHTIIAAEGEFRTAGEVDQDDDGLGEYAFLGELAGNLALRDAINVRNVVPAYLPFSLQTDANGNAKTHGYLLTVYLSDGANGALAEPGNTGPGSVAPNSADIQELGYVCYAWPVQRGRTGNRAFATSEEGEIYETKMGALGYDGLNSVPAANAIFTGLPFLSTLGVRGAGPSNDGNFWLPASG